MERRTCCEKTAGGNRGHAALNRGNAAINRSSATINKGSAQTCAGGSRTRPRQRRQYSGAQSPAPPPL
eukprot:1933149-Rhodomonas_salina.1